MQFKFIVVTLTRRRMTGKYIFSSDVALSCVLFSPNEKKPVDIKDYLGQWFVAVFGL